MARSAIGGVELADLDLDAWRARLAWVPQRPHLFNASIAENVRLGRAATRRARRSGPRSADAGLEDAVRRLPRGLDTVLGERGAGLSAGERQRLALARAFLRDAPLLLLDEPTANLDGETEREVVRAIRRLSRGRTVVLVAHRPALIAMADRVLELEPLRRSPRERPAAPTPRRLPRRATGRRRRCCARSRSPAPPPGAWRSRRCSARAPWPPRSG